MRTARKLLFAALAAACLAPASGALAADLFEPVIEEPDAVPFVETGVNWYLRGDIGYRRYNSPDVFYTGYAPPIDAFFSERLRSIATFGGGFGLRLNSWFRTDVTVDYGSKSKFTGRLTCPGACGGLGAGLTSSESAKLSATTILANAYLDLGHWYGFTPYVGAGIGASNLEISDYTFINPDGTVGANPSGKRWGLTWALMAGLAVQITDGLSVDAGYRYLDLGKTRSGVVFGGPARVEFKDITAHEFRVGLRYAFN